MRARIICVIVLIATAACSGNSASKTVHIGAIYPVSGKQGEGGIEESRGTQLAVELANRDGGINGTKIKVDLVDVEAGGDAPAAIETLHRHGVGLVLGTYGSTISAPASVAAAQRKMVLWETGAVGEKDPAGDPGRYFFRLAPRGTDLGGAAISFVEDQLAPTLPKRTALRYAVAYVDDAYGRAVGLGAIGAAQHSKGVLAGAFPYDVNRLDAAALVARIAAAKPDVLFVSAYLNDGVALRRETIKQHVPLLASIGTSSSYCMPDFAARLGAGAVGLFASDKPGPEAMRTDRLTPDARDALVWARAEYRERFGEAMTGAALAGFANSWVLLMQVLPHAKSWAPSDIAEAARTIKLATGSLPNGAGLDLVGPGQPDAGENRGARSVIWQWVTATDQEIVWPPTFATQPLRAIPIQT